MAAIEVITSQERKVERNGEVRYERVWNSTVANLTLMAFGSSAPEILITVVEICAQGFKAGDLGPGAIFGSAAFNLFMIIAICILVIPRGEVRRIEYLRVFIVTATWSLLAYIWVYIMLGVVSKGVIEVWEGVLTLLFFPIAVYTAYLAEKKCGIAKIREILCAMKYRRPEDAARAKDRFIRVLQDLRDKFPNKPIDELAPMAQERIASCPKSRAYYRIVALRPLSGTASSLRMVEFRPPRRRQENLTYVCFAQSELAVLENIGTFSVSVLLQGPVPKWPVSVDYRSADGSAFAGHKYLAVAGSLTFQSHQGENHFKMRILDNDIFEEDSNFWVHLTGARDGAGNPIPISYPSSIRIWILDDDHCGAFTFVSNSTEASETVGELLVPAMRHKGARGVVSVRFSTRDGSALAERDYIPTEGVLRFENAQTEKHIKVKIVPRHSCRRNIYFFITLDEPILLGRQGIESGQPILGDYPTVKVLIKECVVLKKTIADFTSTSVNSMPADIIKSVSWKQQFKDAIKLKPEPNDNGDPPSVWNYVTHYMVYFWKVLFAIIPPPYMLKGWFCFVVSVFFIGILTVIIRDLASLFGCSLGIKDSVTAISVVALGTSLPDTFASRFAAIHNETADDSIGNVTGSNAVNVFLGIGSAWCIAAVYHACHGQEFRVAPGSLKFSVVLFIPQALLAIIVILLRRHEPIGGELGGPMVYRYITSIFLISLWVVYLALATLEAYGIIKGF